MKNVFQLMVTNAASIICAVGAVYMAVHGISGWGWFLIISAISIDWRIDR